MDKKNASLSPFNAKIKIYDQIGNVVADETFTVVDRAFVYKWYAVNKKGRSVGAGTYLSVVNVYENDTKVWGIRKNIGVKRSKK
jgi:hypothetical protein